MSCCHSALSAQIERPHIYEYIKPEQRNVPFAKAILIFVILPLYMILFGCSCAVNDHHTIYAKQIQDIQYCNWGNPEHTILLCDFRRRITGYIMCTRSVDIVVDSLNNQNRSIVAMCIQALQACIDNNMRYKEDIIKSYWDNLDEIRVNLKRIEGQDDKSLSLVAAQFRASVMNDVSALETLVGCLKYDYPLMYHGESIHATVQSRAAIILAELVENEGIQHIINNTLIDHEGYGDIEETMMKWLKSGKVKYNVFKEKFKVEE